MSAWFVLSALGLYLLEPGSPNFALGSPLFRSVVLRPQGRPALRVTGHDNRKSSPYVAAAFFRSIEGDWTKLSRPEVRYDALSAGGELRFEMSSKPTPDHPGLRTGADGSGYGASPAWPLLLAAALVTLGLVATATKLARAWRGRRQLRVARGTN